MDPNGQDGAKTPWQFQPGDTVTPDGQQAPAASPEQSVDSAEPSPAPAPVAPPTDTANAPQASDSPAEPTPAAPLQPSTDSDSIEWTASEFIAHDKSAGWYGLLVLGTLVLAAIIFLLTRDKISTGVVVVAGLALGFYGHRKPRQLRYALNGSGLTIGDKHYPLEQFRSFAVMDEGGAFSSIAFLPLKRFGQLVTIYYDPNDEDAIVDLLGDRLPMEPRQHDAVDRLMKKIRF